MFFQLYTTTMDNFQPRTDESRIMESAFCAMLDNPPGFPLWEFSSLVFFAIPMAVMVVLYGRMGLQIRFRSKHTSVLGTYTNTERLKRVQIVFSSIFVCLFDKNALSLVDLKIKIEFILGLQAFSRARCTANPDRRKTGKQSFGCSVS